MNTSTLTDTTLGAILTTSVTFLPSFLWIIAGAPFIEKIGGNVAPTTAAVMADIAPAIALAMVASTNRI